VPLAAAPPVAGRSDSVGGVRRQQTSITGRLARWALLACTLVGLAAMHSLGHDGGARASVMLAEGHHASVMTLAAADRMEDCTEDGCTHLSALPGGSGGDMPAWTVCLAVLGGFAIVVLLGAALLAAARRYNPTRALPGRSGAGPRAPPGLLPVGLTLATVSVLRR
jgi:hypothetical protein